MSFTLGVREYNGKRYITLEDEIKDLVHWDDHIILRNKAIIELLSLEPDHAFRLIKRFKNIFLEVERDFFKVQDYNSESALEQFELVANLRGIIVKKSSRGNDVIVTSNFTNSLENDIWARGFTISQLEDALKSAIEDKLPDPVSIFVENEAIDSLPYNNTFEKDEVDWSLWVKITEQGTLINTIIKTKETLHPENANFLLFLNDKGKSVFNDIKTYYNKARPVDVFAVFYAMVDLDLILSDKKNLLKPTRKVVAEAIGSAFGTSLSPQIVGHNINKYENRSDKQKERINDAKNIITGFLAKKGNDF